MPPHLYLILKHKNIIKMNLDLMGFILEILFLTEIKDVAYIINLDESVNVGTHWIAFYVHNDNVYLILLV